MTRNTAGQTIGAQMIKALDGSAFSGTVTVYITIDAGTQAIGSVGSGLCTSEGNGYYTYAPSASETDGALVAFTFIGSGAIPQTIQVATVTAAQSQALSTSTGGSVFTVGDLITRSLRRINVLQAGETPSNEDSADALLILQMMLGSWRLERLTIPFIQRTTWTITSTKGTIANPYSVGLGGDVNVARPSLPNAITVRYQNTSISPTLEFPLVPLTPEAYQAIPQKDLTGPVPAFYHYQPTYANRLGALYLWLVPTGTTLQGVLYSPAAIQDYSALTDTILLPDGYTLALQDNLAMLLWPEWRENVQVDPVLRESALLSKALIKAANVVLPQASLDPAITAGAGIYNIFSDS